MFRAGLNVYSYRSRLGVSYRRHLVDGQNMRPRWQLDAIAATLYDVCHRLAVDPKIETEIPSEVRRSFDGEEARREVTRVEVTRPGTSLRHSADENCAPKNQDQKNIHREAVFGFHGTHYTCELNYRQR